MRKGLGIGVAVAAGALLAGVAAAVDHDRVREFVGGYVAPARTAYVVLNKDPLSSGSYERAAGLIQQARQRDRQAAWVYIALAKATLVYGYRQGSRYRADSFLPEAVDRARRFADRAVELGPEESFAHAFRGRIALIDDQRDNALDWLQRAQRLDENSFHPRYFKSVLYRQAGELDKARECLDQADRRRQHPYQARWILEGRRDLAAASDDVQRTEDLHRRIIRRYPESAKARAEYGGS